MMKPFHQPKRNVWISAFMLMFVIHTVQIGVGLVGMPRVVFLEVQQDAWISVIVGSISSIFFVLIIYLSLKPFGRLDLYQVHELIYGRWLGKFFSFLYVLYLSSTFFTIVLNYIEMIQAWVFNLLPTSVMYVLLSALAVYAVLGGIRVLTGVAIMSFLLSTWLMLMIGAPIQSIDTTQYFPMFNHSWNEIMLGAFKTSLTVLGFELLYFIYPFVDQQEKTMKFVSIALLYTCLQITVITIVCIGFFSDEALEKTIWPILSMFKIVRLPNLERFEFIAVSFWMLVILPTMSFYLWAASRGLRQIFHFPQKYSVWVIVVIGFFVQLMLPSRMEMNFVTDKVATIGFIMAFMYPVIVYIVVQQYLYRKKRKRDDEKTPVV